MTLNTHRTVWRKACGCKVPQVQHLGVVAQKEILGQMYGNPPTCPYCRKVFEQRIVRPEG